MGLSETGPAFTQAPLRHFTSLSGSLVPCCRHETLLAFPQGILMGFPSRNFPALEFVPVCILRFIISDAGAGSWIFGSLPRAALFILF